MQVQVGSMILKKKNPQFKKALNKLRHLKLEFHVFIAYLLCSLSACLQPPISWQSLIQSIKLCTFDIFCKKGIVARSYCYCSVRLQQEKEKTQQGQWKGTRSQHIEMADRKLLNQSQDYLHVLCMMRSHFTCFLYLNALLLLRTGKK